MQHFLYRMSPDVKAPASGGDTKSWFLYYKWQVLDNVFVPADLRVFGSASIGDMLWFAFDRKKGGAALLGGSILTDVTVLHAQGLVELWYNTENNVHVSKSIKEKSGLVPSKVGELWLPRNTV